MSDPNNPAGRLHALLKQAKVPANKNDSTKVRERWAEVLGLEPGDRTALLAHLSEIITLPNEVRLALSKVPNLDAERYAKPLDNIERAFSNVNLKAQWHSFAQPIDAATMAVLDLCDERLSAELPERVFPDDERKATHQTVRQLFEDVEANEEDAELREFLLRHLAAMDRALQEYRISGTVPVEETIAGAVGDLALRRHLGEEPPRSSRSDKFWQLMARIAISLNIAGIALPEGVASVLSSEDPSAVVEIVDAEEPTGYEDDE